MRFAASLAFLLVIPYPALAQSIEKTVQFMLFGTNAPVDNGQAVFTPLDGAGMHVKMQREDISAQVEASECEIRASFKGTADNKPISVDLQIDMSEASSIEFGGMSSGLKRVSFADARLTCQSDSEQHCEGIKRGFPNIGPEERVRKAYAYYRDAFCKGSAF